MFTMVGVHITILSKSTKCIVVLCKKEMDEGWWKAFGVLRPRTWMFLFHKQPQRLKLKAFQGNYEGMVRSKLDGNATWIICVHNYAIHDGLFNLDGANGVFNMSWDCMIMNPIYGFKNPKGGSRIRMQNQYLYIINIHWTLTLISTKSKTYK
jgi:hypothetical protein